MKKILVYNTYYIPAVNYGGPTTSLKSIIDNCSDDFEFYVIAANHDFNDEKIFTNIHDGWNIVGKAKVLYIDLKDIFYKTSKFKEIVCSINPDLVWTMGILVPGDNWFIAKVCKDNGIPLLVSPRGEVCHNTFHMKYVKKKIVSVIARLIGVYDNAFFHATSEEEREGLIKYYGVDSKKVFLVPNISSNLELKKHVIKKNKNELNVVFISRIQEKKNLLDAVVSVSKLKGRVKFDIYGPMESPDYWERCKSNINNNSEQVIIQYKGALKPEDVGSTFAKYHCFLFPTISENYGHVIAESISNMCPVLLSRGTTPWDDLDGKAGFTYSLDRKQEIVECLNKVLKMNEEEYKLLICSLQEYFSNRLLKDNAVTKHKLMINEICNQDRQEL